jgi:16S rRNA (cytosine967-C5)-methyltransferase
MSEVLKNARDTALDVLMSVHKANAWSDGGLKRAIARNRLDSRDAALTTRLCYGVLQNRMLLDYYIGCYCTQRPEKLEPVILNILRLGGYQILFMDKIPNSAAVNESVEMTKRNGRPKAAGMVNAVLRKFVIHWLDMPAIPTTDRATGLSIRYSHPKWLVQRLLTLLPEVEAEAYLRLDNEPVPTAIQTNTLHITPEELAKELKSEQVTFEAHPWLEGCFYISGTGNLENLPSFNKGHWMVQDPAAKLVALAACPKAGKRVLDVCAAPGGKTFAVAIAQGDSGDILACDMHPHKLQLIDKSAQRLQITSVRSALADGREKHAAWVGKADLVLADVPCSGLGIIRKKPDIRYKNEKEIAALPAIQHAILSNSSSYVRPGGLLVYSTCTVLPEENEQVTDAFLKEHPEFHREPFELPSPIGGTDGQITLWPQRFGTDGFYICCMRREGGQ